MNEHMQGQFGKMWPYIWGRVLAISEQIEREALGTELQVTLPEARYGIATNLPRYAFRVLMARIFNTALPQLERVKGEERAATLGGRLCELAAGLYDQMQEPACLTIAELNGWAIGFGAEQNELLA